MLKEIRNNVYNALFVAADEEGQRYAAFESDWNFEVEIFYRYNH